MATRHSLLIPLLVAVGLLFGTAVASAAPQGQAGPPDMARVFVVFDRQPGADEAALVRGAGGSIRHSYHLIPAIAATLPQTAIAGLERNPRVVRIEPVIEAHAVDLATELANTWGVDKIGAGTVHADGSLGRGVKVAVIDSGINYDHLDLGASYAGGYDFANKDADPLDDNGHGTHVAGTVAAVRNGAGVVGVAPEARIYALKVLGADGGGYYDDIVAAIEWCVSNGIQVTNNSYGSSANPGTTVKAAFDNAYAAGVLHIAAAGNEGNVPGNRDTVIYPARWESVVAVAATNSSDTRATFSSTGPAVELAAPGVSINSTLMGGGYGTMSGTSMASPHATGVAALVIASGVTSHTQVRARLQEAVVDLGPTGRDTHYGFGRVDAVKAVGSAPPPANSTPVVEITTPAAGSTFQVDETITFSGTASDAEDGDLSAGLIWTSSLDGQIGTGASVSSSTLREGQHTISASVTDSGGKTGSASISITVGSPPSSPTTAKVESIGYATEGGRNQNAHLRVIGTVVNDQGGPVAGASVSIELYRDGGLYMAATGSTGTDGTVSFKSNNAPAGSYTTKVTNVSATGLTWDGATPDNSFLLVK